MNDLKELKETIRRITTDFLFDEAKRPTSHNVFSVAKVEEAVAAKLQAFRGRQSLNPDPRSELTGEDADMFLEVVWDLLCARVITPQNHLNGFNEKGLNQFRLHSDYEANWKKFETTADTSDEDAAPH